MEYLKSYLMVLCMALAGLMIVPTRARPDELDRKTTVTFSSPVEIPNIVLPPGTYVFRLLDPAATQNVVQVLSEDEQRVYATILAIPDYRLKPPDKTVISFEERAAGSPQAIKAWFYPGIRYGEEFIYPRFWQR